ncbi:MAG: cbb3-type cytochrome oxidase subunit 3, partial [Cellvibrionaceae bacterium]
WAFSPKRKKQFEKAAHLPFDDDDQHKRTASKSDAEQSDDKNQ